MRNWEWNYKYSQTHFQMGDRSFPIVKDNITKHGSTPLLIRDLHIQKRIQSLISNKAARFMGDFFATVVFEIIQQFNRIHNVHSAIERRAVASRQNTIIAASTSL